MLSRLLELYENRRLLKRMLAWRDTITARRGTCRWTVVNGVCFHFGYANRGLAVEAVLTNPVNGERTTLWDSGNGWGVTNPVLRQWMWEGVDLLAKAHAASVLASQRDQTIKEELLALAYRDRLNAPPPTVME